MQAAVALSLLPKVLAPLKSIENIAGRFQNILSKAHVRANVSVSLPLLEMSILLDALKERGTVSGASPQDIAVASAVTELMKILGISDEASGGN